LIDQPTTPTTNYEQSVGQIIGDVLKQLDEERFIVKASSGPRYVVGGPRFLPPTHHSSLLLLLLSLSSQEG